LHFDLTFQDKLLLGGLNYNVNLYPNIPEFYLKSTIDNLSVKVEFTHAEYKLYRVKVTPAVYQAHMLALSKNGPAKYHITRTETKPVILNSGMSTIIVDNALSGQQPNQLYISFVTNDAFKGNFKLDPFLFKNLNLDYICAITQDGQIPLNGYKPNFNT